AVLPVRIHHGQMLLAFVPQAQLVEYPACFFLHGRIDLRQCDPVWRGYLQAVVIDDQPDALAPWAAQYETDGLPAGLHFAPARTRRQGGRTDRGNGLRALEGRARRRRRRSNGRRVARLEQAELLILERHSVRG